MNSMYYSAATRGFYEHPADDRVEVPYDDYTALLQSPMLGMVIVPNAEGYPVAVTVESTFTLDELKRNSISKIESTYLNLTEQPIEYSGHAFDVDDASTALMSKVLAIGSELPEDFKWRTSDNFNLPMQRAQLAELAQLILLRSQKQYWHKQALKELVRECTTVAQVNSIEWGAV